MKIAFCPYQLSFQKSFKSQKQVEGLLIRVTESNRVGYSCMQPWPLLGDPDLQNLMKRRDHSLWKVAIANAQRDALARSRGLNLTESKIPLENNFLILNPDSITEKLLTDLQQRKFSRLKIKLDSNWKLHWKSLQ